MHRPLLHAISSQAIARITAFKCQDLANSAWAVSTLQGHDSPLCNAIAAQALARRSEFAAQSLANTAWSFATLLEPNETLLDAIAAQSRSTLSAFKSQEISNLAWSFSTLALAHLPLLDSIAAASIKSISEATTRNSANTAWSFSVLRFEHRPLLEALASAAIPKRQELSTLSLASTAWACAQLSCAHGPLLSALASEWRRAPQWGDDGVRGMAVWSLSPLDNLAPALSLAEMEGTSSLSIGPLLAACEQRGLFEEELRLLRYLARGSLRGPALNVGALRLLEEQRPGDAREVLLQLADDGLFDGVSEQLWHRCSGGRLCPQLRGEYSTLQPGPAESHEKEIRLLAHVLSNALPGNPTAVCEAIESFGNEALAPRGQWLKVAGGDKAAVLLDAVRRKGGAGDATPRVLEVGAYCGYSAIVMATALPSDLCGVTTLEADPAHVIIARCVVAYAGLSDAVKVRTGHSRDVLPQLKNEAADAFDVVFFDQRGARYREDLLELEGRRLLRPGCIIVCDNVLKPGAPGYLWHVIRAGAPYDTRIVSLEEFAMLGAEDWMSVSTYRPGSGHASPVPPPSAILRLEREADRMRARAQASAGGGGVAFADWAAFASLMRREMAEQGIGPENLDLVRH